MRVMGSMDPLMSIADVSGGPIIDTCMEHGSRICTHTHTHTHTHTYVHTHGEERVNTERAGG